METYHLYVTCSKDGSVRDGGLQSQGEFASDQKAVNHFKSEEKGGLLQSSFDRIQYTVMRGGSSTECGEQVQVKKWSWSKPTRVFDSFFNEGSNPPFA